ncbi:hypothetical protein GCM10027275_44790 [Rhabdobacter roseus]|uniref:DUF4350 domain-containing protein n=1 Tax=Rhabdobacter roseus TaxID=1655419 RepID=A0A840TSC6_9BACT|nr:DUF4350 domain-containing protein [Rhabdobacter roseus]MBB5286851.1 hypothetical protein [Rhabdobacter roseus]
MPFRLSRFHVFLLLALVGYGLFEYYRPKPIDWRPTFSNKDNIPFGTEVLYRLLPDLLQQPSIPSLRVPPFNHLREGQRPARSTCVYIQTNFSIDKNDREALLKYVREGNTVFISAYSFADSLLPTLGLRAVEHPPALRDTAQRVNFANPALRARQGYLFSQDDGRNYFRLGTSPRITVLGVNQRREPIFVRVAYGQGTFLLHNLPLAFTNYYVLAPSTSDYAFRALSYLPQQPTYWDEYQKQGRFGANESSVLRYIATEPALRAAYYLALIGLVAYALLAGKRRQRVIPVLEPPRNSSLEFVRTIGHMYYRRGDHANLARKRIQYFWLYVWERFGLRADDALREPEQLARKSGLALTEVQALLADIRRAEANAGFSAEALRALNEQIELFYQKTNEASGTFLRKMH